MLSLSSLDGLQRRFHPVERLQKHRALSRKVESHESLATLAILRSVAESNPGFLQEKTKGVPRNAGLAVIQPSQVGPLGQSHADSR